MLLLRIMGSNWAVQHPSPQPVLLPPVQGLSTLPLPIPLTHTQTHVQYGGVQVTTTFPLFHLTENFKGTGPIAV